MDNDVTVEKKMETIKVLIQSLQEENNIIVKNIDVTWYTSLRGDAKYIESMKIESCIE